MKLVRWLTFCYNSKGIFGNIKTYFFKLSFNWFSWRRSGRNRLCFLSCINWFLWRRSCRSGFCFLWCINWFSWSGPRRSSFCFCCINWFALRRSCTSNFVFFCRIYWFSWRRSLGLTNNWVFDAVDWKTGFCINVLSIIFTFSWNLCLYFTTNK